MFAIKAEVTDARAESRRAQRFSFSAWDDVRPETELSFKLCRQATDKIVGISEEAAAFLGEFF